MPFLEVLRRIKLSSDQKPTGAVQHYRGGKALGPAHELQIVRYPTDEGYYLVRVDSQGREQTDTYHSSLDLALEQAHLEYGVKPELWEVYAPPERRKFSNTPPKQQASAAKIQSRLRSGVAKRAP